MDYNYLVWSEENSDDYCILNYLLNVEKDFELKKGISRINNFPEDACFHMYKDSPNAIKLSDNIENFLSTPVISQKLMEFVKTHKPKSVEFLPVTIYNHQGKVASKNYFIMNPLIVQDCIDLEKSEVTWMTDGSIAGWNELTLDTKRIDDTLLLFRPKYNPSTIIIREDFANAIEEEDFTGIGFEELDECES